MQDHSNRLRGVGLQQGFRTLHAHSRVVLIKIRSKLLRRDGREFGAYPARFNEQRVNI